MLRELRLKNFILMENVRLEFGAGLNVLTGETGAGKSIVLEALGLLLGERFSSDQIRQGAERGEIDAVFDAPKTKEFREWWKAREYAESDELLIHREGFPDGRSRATLNDRPVTLATLQELGELLVDIHGQFEHQQILKPATQSALLDRFGELQETCAAVRPLYQAWQKLSESLQSNVLSEQEKMHRVDLYRFQLREIEQAKLTPGEADELAARLPELKNAEKLRVLAQGAYDLLYQQEGSVVEKLGQVERAFSALAALAPATDPLQKEIQDVRSRLEETAHALQAQAERWDVEPGALETLVSRQDLLSRLQKKYGESIEAILTYAEKIRTELDQLENSESYRQELEKQCEQAREALRQACRDLSRRRKSAARELGETVQKQLKDLGLGQAVFACRLEPLEEGHFTPTGTDRVSFEWSPNPGEGQRPLKEIVSGGEMSRVMLALKTVLAHADAVPTLVFDEVDAGIGGLTAQSVGRKLRALSKHHQILCVSHLPQIASCAHVHFQVAKHVAKSRTTATATRLESDDRIEELARLLGSHITPASVQHAKELLAQNQ